MRMHASRLTDLLFVLLLLVLAMLSEHFRQAADMAQFCVTAGWRAQHACEHTPSADHFSDHTSDHFSDDWAARRDSRSCCCLPTDGLTPQSCSVQSLSILAQIGVCLDAL